MIETIQLNGKTIEVHPISWGELPHISVKLAEAMEGFDAVRMAFFKFVTAKKKGDEAEILKEVMAAAPQLVTVALAAILHIEPVELQKADALEVAKGISVVMRVIRFHELLAEGKKLKGLMEPAGAKQATLQPAVAENRAMRRRKQ